MASLTILNRSRSSTMVATADRRRRPERRLLEPVDEERPIGQPGQRVSGEPRDLRLQIPLLGQVRRWPEAAVRSRADRGGRRRQDRGGMLSRRSPDRQDPRRARPSRFASRSCSESTDSSCRVAASRRTWVPTSSTPGTCSTSRLPHLTRSMAPSARSSRPSRATDRWPQQFLGARLSLALRRHIAHDVHRPALSPVSSGSGWPSPRFGTPSRGPPPRG